MTGRTSGADRARGTGRLRATMEMELAGGRERRRTALIETILNDALLRASWRPIEISSAAIIMTPLDRLGLSPGICVTPCVMQGLASPFDYGRHLPTIERPSALRDVD